VRRLSTVACYGVACESDLEWWTSELSRPRPCHDDTDALCVEGAHPFVIDDTSPIITIEEGDLEPDVIAETWIEHDIDGAILRARIVMAIGWWNHSHLRRELGHALGLENDPPSFDVRSIMSDTVLPGAQLTDHDERLLRPWL